MTAANIENQRVNRGKGEKCGERVDGGRIRNKKGAKFKARTLSWQKLRLLIYSSRLIGIEIFVVVIVLNIPVS